MSVRTAVHQLSGDISSSALCAGFVLSYLYTLKVYTNSPCLGVTVGQAQSKRHCSCCLIESSLRCRCHMVSDGEMEAQRGQACCPGSHGKQSWDLNWNLSDPKAHAFSQYTILPCLEHTPAEIHCSLQNMSEMGVSVDANELNLFTHFKTALVYFECKMSTGIFNV